MSVKLTWPRMATLIAARQCFEAGQSVNEIAGSAKLPPSRVRRWLRSTGLRSTRRRVVT